MGLTVEQSKSKSTQPRSETYWDTLFSRFPYMDAQCEVCPWPCILTQQISLLRIITPPANHKLAPLRTCPAEALWRGSVLFNIEQPMLPDLLLHGQAHPRTSSLWTATGCILSALEASIHRAVSFKHDCAHHMYHFFLTVFLSDQNFF